MDSCIRLSSPSEATEAALGAGAATTLLAAAVASAAAEVQGGLVRVAAQAREAAPERTGKFGAGRWWFLVRAEGRKRFANASCNDAGRS